jgi:elongation factor P
MLEYNEILPRRFIIVDGAPYEVVDAHIFRMQQRKPQNKTKLRNMITGSIKEMTFHQAEKVEEAEVEDMEIKYLYTNKGEWWFSEASDPSKRFKLDEEVIGNGRVFLKGNMILDALVFEEKVIGVKLPIKIDLKVTDAPPAVKGDTAKGGSKIITLETGATINAPLFINEGDIIRVNTDTGDYVERA